LNKLPGNILLGVKAGIFFSGSQLQINELKPTPLLPQLGYPVIL
jgi:hypothetical protein